MQVSVCPALPTPVPERFTALPLQPGCIAAVAWSVELIWLPREGKQKAVLAQLVLSCIFCSFENAVVVDQNEQSPA